MRRLTILLFALLCANPAHAINILIDYTYDTGFFNNLEARAAVEKAASDLGAAITSKLASVSTDTFTGTNGNATLTIDWSLYFDNPSNPDSEVEIPSFGSLFPANTIRIYAGGAALSGPLGKGGPATGGYGIDGSTKGSSYGPALTSAANQSNSALTRGGGPVIGSLEEADDGASAVLSFGSIAGKLSIDTATNWHLDTNTLPQAGEFDLYTAALHEMMHAIGFGTSASWDADVSGTNWLGANVIALTDGGIDVLSEDQAHIKSGTMSPGIYDGIPQLTVMDPFLAAGVRKELTELDLAFLRDLGFETIAVLAVFALGAVRYVRRRAA